MPRDEPLDVLPAGKSPENGTSEAETQAPKTARFLLTKELAEQQAHRFARIGRSADSRSMSGSRRSGSTVVSAELSGKSGRRSWLHRGQGMSIPRSIIGILKSMWSNSRLSPRRRRP